MKKILSLMMMLLCVSSLFAATPAEQLVDKYKEVKGARNLIAGKMVVRLVRPMMKDYQIAPLAHKVEELSVLRVDKTSPEVRAKFLKDLKKVFDQYVFGGQSVTRNGTVDAYVHMTSEDTADELVVYNPKLYALYSVSGIFTREELEKIQKKP